jgi:Co/Zn/Cd efflux system component
MHIARNPRQVHIARKVQKLHIPRNMYPNGQNAMLWAGLLGRTINTASGGVLGKYGHELINKPHPGGGWDIHHDAMTNVMASVGLVFGAFVRRVQPVG